MNQNKPLKVTGISQRVRDWFYLLHDDIHTMAEAEIIKQGRSHRLHDTVNSLRSALDQFSWEDTEQGHEYWSTLSQDIKSGNQDRLNDDISQLFD